MREEFGSLRLMSRFGVPFSGARLTDLRVSSRGVLVLAIFCIRKGASHVTDEDVEVSLTYGTKTRYSDGILTVFNSDWSFL